MKRQPRRHLCLFRKPSAQHADAALKRAVKPVLPKPVDKRVKVRGNQLRQLRGMVRDVLLKHKHIPLVRRVQRAQLKQLVVLQPARQRRLTKHTMLKKLKKRQVRDANVKARMKKAAKRRVFPKPNPLLQPVVLKHYRPVQRRKKVRPLVQIPPLHPRNHVVNLLPHDRQLRPKRGLLPGP